MKSLNTLIRLQKRKVDDLRRNLAQIENQKQQMLDRIAALEDELQRELQLGEKSPEMAAFFGDFVGRIRKRKLEITEEIKKIEKKIDVAREQVRLAFGELKRYEIVRDRRLEEAKKLREKREGEELDEIALQRHVRKEVTSGE